MNQLDYKGRTARKKTHRRYSDQTDRPDLRALAICNDTAGPVIAEPYLTSSAPEVTCGRCKRIMASRASAEETSPAMAEVASALSEARFRRDVLTAVARVVETDRVAVLDAIREAVAGVSAKETTR
jgi:hypothetical protein